MKSIAVYCGSSDGNKLIFREAAYSLGLALASHDIELVYGGAKVGLMGAVATGAIEAKGRVIGVLPEFLAAKELRYDGLTDLIIVDNMHERKAKMSELAQGFIALPGGFGTMEELFETLTWAQLSLHKKPVGLLNVDGYYDALLEFVDKIVSNGFMKPEYRKLILVSADIEDLLQQMREYKSPLNQKWADPV